jgi:hypothetical protein
MSQVVFDTIDPTNTSGTELANILNNWKNAALSGYIGATRPDQVTAGGSWIDTSLQVSDGKWRLRLYTGTVELTLMEINLTTNSVSFPGSDNSFAITRVSEDAVGAMLRLVKKRVTATQVKMGDTLGSVSFYGYTASSVETESARFRAEARQDFTSGALGTDFIFETTKSGENTPTEHMRMTNGKMTVGPAGVTPVEVLEVAGSIVARRSGADALPARVITSKKRTSGGGQSLLNDYLSEYLARGYDETGAEVDLMKMSVRATQDITTTAHGTRISFEKKDTGGIVYFEKMAITDEGVEASNLTLIGSLRNSTAIDVSTGSDIDLPNPHKGIIVLTSNTLVSIRGITLPIAGEEFKIINATGNNVVIKNNVTAAGTLKILSGSGDDLDMADGTVITVVRDGNSSVYRIIGGTGGSGGGKKFSGTYGTPTSLTTGTVPFSGNQDILVSFVKGASAGATVVLAGSPIITAGNKIGQELWLIFTSATDLVDMNTGGNILTKGEFLSDEGSIIKFMWVGTAWLEIGRE